MRNSTIVVAGDALAASVGRICERLPGRRLELLRLPGLGAACAPAELADGSDSRLTLVQAYETVANRLEACPPQELRDTTVMLATPVSMCAGEAGALWNPLRFLDSRHQRALPVELVVSWLVLSFPEVHWAFWPGGHGELAGAARDGQNEADEAVAYRALERWHVVDPLAAFREKFSTTPRVVLAEQCSGLFDPSGLRAAIRSMIAGCRNGDEPPPACRRQIAVCVDDEGPCALLAAYAAYRFGYRVWAITDWEAMEKLLGRGVAAGGLREVSLVFEDLYLSFPDQPQDFPAEAGFPEEDCHLSNLAFRDHRCPGLTSASRRVFITVGHQRTLAHEQVWRANQEYLAELAVTAPTVYKPISGMFRLWRDAGLWHRGSNRPQPAPDFVWPPRDQDGIEAVNQHHSAPGRILVVADRLLARAKRLLSGCSAVEDAVHAAILALEAKELLGGKTPTTSIEALATQHEAEAVAESLSQGVTYALEVRSRLDDIRREARQISGWFHHSHRQRTAKNARLVIVERLAKRFGEATHTDELLACLAEARRLHFDLLFTAKPWRLLLWPLAQYVAFALSSLPRFAGLVLAWILLFGCLNHLAAPQEPGGLPSAIVAALYFAFTQCMPAAWSLEFSTTTAATAWTFYLGFQGFLSFIHLGLLLSHLFLIVSRR